MTSISVNYILMAFLTFHNIYVVKLIITILKEHIFALEYFNSVLQTNLGYSCKRQRTEI